MRNVPLDAPAPGAPSKLHTTPRDLQVLMRAAALIVEQPPNPLRNALAIASYLAIENNAVRCFFYFYYYYYYAHRH